MRYYSILYCTAHHPYTVKKGIVRCLQHRAKTKSLDSDAYKKETKSLRGNFHRNNYPEIITSTTRNLDQTTKNNTRKLTPVFLSFVKGLAEKIQQICCSYIKIVFRSGTTLRKYIFQVKSPSEYMTKNCVDSIPCRFGKVYKSETRLSLKVRREEYRKYRMSK